MLFSHNELSISVFRLTPGDTDVILYKILYQTGPVLPVFDHAPASLGNGGLVGSRMRLPFDLPRLVRLPVKAQRAISARINSDRRTGQMHSLVNLVDFSEMVVGR